MVTTHLPPEDWRDKPSLVNWLPMTDDQVRKLKHDAFLDIGWGKLIFGHTFLDLQGLARMIADEDIDKRNIAVYNRDPHVLLSLAPQDLFLDPSHMYRLDLAKPARPAKLPQGFEIQEARDISDFLEMNRIFKTLAMMPLDVTRAMANHQASTARYLVARDLDTGMVVGTVTGVDHCAVFEDPEQGCSLWCLAVDPQCAHPGVGTALVNDLAVRFRHLKRRFMDLSVIHDNQEAIALYERLGFARVPAYSVKCKNAFNEPLYAVPQQDSPLNPYARIIVNEARVRGIAVDVIDAQDAYFSLSYGGRTVLCRESLTELTSAIAMSRCQDKRVTQRMLRKAGFRIPGQRETGTSEENLAFLEEYGEIVVKPALGEQGHGVSVGIKTLEELEEAIEGAGHGSGPLILEECVKGEDVRIICIDFKFAAAAVRRPPQIIGTGHHSVLELIEKQSRRRQAATDGESCIPLDRETRRCVAAAGYHFDEILPEGAHLMVRRTANVHTGGTIHDITEELHPEVVHAAEEAARILDIPVVGFDFFMPDLQKTEYWIIEANERPGLANHEPQPMAQLFLDFLFPNSAKDQPVPPGEG
ncbi:N-acetylglutaminylglutamine synthetase [Sulfidibacter corallicola]|uniref:N-acetylglutaminylglutamine synthetase n=1 Tax=Sulfidibacter corallicola TaxID=2818388 RepID=A0A8A4TLE1_SULCO|nr:N-acetylglutaminylglutamine synthetase [Sulfidibacter corallicola]QTD49701.1 N-acetylglutaminylglutamine synthetase [Sulfidibacter corallicola]